MKTVPARALYAHRAHIITSILTITLLLAAHSLNSQAAVNLTDLDTDSDGLEDVWELQHFNGLSHTDGDPTDDPDGDGKDNAHECNANTDPNNPNSCLSIVDSNFLPTSGLICWPSTFGKRYQLDISDDLSQWQTVGITSASLLDFRGTGGVLEADFSDPQNPLITGAVTRHLWGGLASIPADIDAHFATLIAGDADGDGTQWHNGLTTPANDGEAYSAKLSGYIIPKTNGNYTFHIASRGPGKLIVYTDDTTTTVLATCSVDVNTLTTEQDWGSDPSQSSAQVSLTAGTKYRVEVLHVHDSGDDHLAVGWEEAAAPGTITVVPGDCLSPIEDYSNTNVADHSDAANPVQLFDGSIPKFARVLAHGALSGNDFDADGDNVVDSREIDLNDFGFDPYDPNGTGQGGGDNDGNRLVDLLNFDPVTDLENISVTTTDAQAVENTSPPVLAGNIVDLPNLTPGDTSGTSEDTITFRVTRSQSLQPFTAFYTLGGETTGDGTEVSATSGADYNASENEAPADGAIIIPAGFSSAEIEITVERDPTHEYPETVSCSIDADASYNIGTALAKAEIVDMPADVNILFIGAYEEDFNATPGSTAVNGSVSGYLKGDKRMFILRNDNFGNLSTPQNDTHFHKVALSGPTETGGAAIHDIVNEQGVAWLGHYLTYDWELTDQNPIAPVPGPGSPSRQVVIDSLFNQNSQTEIYVNLHTDNNAAGESMARLVPATGSIDPPAPPAAPPAPGATGFELLTGADLERDIVRFLNQATFGAAWEDVVAIRDAIIAERGSDPTYHRVEEFEKWIDAQAAMEPTYILDYVLAMDTLELNLRGIWDPDEWNDWSNNATDPNGNPPGTADVEPVPTSWPSINRSLTDGPAAGMPTTHPHFWANQWYPEGRYPTDSDWIAWLDDEAASEGTKTVRNLGQRGPQHNNRRRAHWMMMANAKDQLRHKWGYAIQQILVVADTLTQIERQHYAAANYQDMLNLYGLAYDRDGDGTIQSDEQTHFRDLFGFINWSPVMGYWLSSIRNRAAYDSDGDGLVDVFPDENLARENMQLFSIGLFNLWPDGSVQLQAGGSDPNIPPGSSATYDNDDIQEFARVLTGQNVSRRTQNGRSPNNPTANGFVAHGWNNNGFREGPYGWGIESSGTFADKGDIFDTDNTNDTGVAPDVNDGNDGDDGIYYNTSFTYSSNGDDFMGHEWNYPMRMFGKTTSGGSTTAIYHDLGVKTIAGGRVIDNTSLLVPDSQDYTSNSMIALGVADIEAAADWFAGKVDGNAASDFTGAAGDPNSSNASTPPFICRRLIQRMVTSNPSSPYLYRVSKAFQDSEGNMLATCKAVLLDYEARALGNIDETYGMKKSPMEAYIQTIRSFEGHSLLPVDNNPGLRPFADAPYNGAWPAVDGGYNPGNYTHGLSDPHENIFATGYGYPASQADNFRFNCLYQYPVTDGNLSMSPFRQETVFNYYLPDYTRGVVQSAALVAPELQLATETEVVNNHNYFWTLTWQWDLAPRDNRNDGQDVQELGGTNRNQRYAFGQMNNGGDWDNHDKVRINFDTWADIIYASFSENIPASGGRTSESLECEAIVDFIDHRLTGGSFKAAYPYDESNDDSNLTADATENPREPTANDGIVNNDVDARNPREWIIHGLVDAYNDGTTPDNDRVNQFRLALYLFSQTPEFLVKK
ncbi:MAG: DUF1800 family protein [Verrucomicrobiota bacterium]